MPIKRKLVLIDGYAIIHRAFHALPQLTTPKGELVNGVYGFSLLLLNVLKEIKPTYLVVALDVGGATVRHKIFKNYKAHRVKAPEELHNQVPRIKEVLQAFNVPVFEKAGYEADDIIGTLASQTKNYKNLETIIVTGDLDTLQLVCPEVKVFTMRRGLTDTIIYDEKLVKQRYGFEPTGMVDYKGLRGDPSDNIPGVSGIGEKTASELVKKYGSIDKIYQALKNNKLPISERYQELLKEQKKEAFLSKKLAKIITDLPIKLNLEKAELHDYQREKVLQVFQELGFTSLIARLPAPKKEIEAQTLFDKKQIKTKKLHGNYYLVDTEIKFDNLLKKLRRNSAFVFDVETDTLNGRLIGISFAFKEKEAFYLSLTQGNREAILKTIKPFFENSRIKKIGQNLKYDYLILRQEGIKTLGLEFDTMLASYILNPGKRNYDLDSLSFIELGKELTPIEQLIGKGKGQKRLDEIALEKVADYSGEDADFTFRLYKIFRRRLKGKLAEIFYQIEMPLVPVLAEMEKAGIKLNKKTLKKMSLNFAKRIDKISRRIYKYSGEKFNINSTQQLRDVLFEKLKIEAADVKKTKTGISTAAAELEKLRERHGIIDLISKYREITKLKNTYLDALPKLVAPDGRLHTSFNQTIATTGRLSSSGPNLQNIPTKTELGRKIRQAFVAESGFKLLAFDYSQIELRVVAHLAQDKKMISAFQKGEDIHSATASFLFHKPTDKISSFERREAKTVNFGVLYGMSSYGLSRGMGLARASAREFIGNYFDTFKGIREYLEKTKKTARERGYVETLFGRRRYIPEINSSVFNIVLAAERMAINMPVQGTAADIIKLAMIRIQEEILDKSSDIRLILQVHDELVFEVKKNKIKDHSSQIQKIMEEVCKLSVPIKVDVSVGKNWGNLKKLKN